MNTSDAKDNGGRNGPPFPDVLVTIEDARRSIGHVSKNRVYDYIRAGLLEAKQVGRRTFVTGESLRALPSKFPDKIMPPKSGERA